MNEKKIKISIITPSYNNVSTIEQTICSVLNQTYPYIEYIIVDGNSTDGTKDILEKYSSKIRFISEDDDGLYYAANKALSMCNGDYIQFIGADDCLKDSETISSVVEYIYLNPSVDVICANRINVDEKTHLEYVFRSNVEQAKANSKILLNTPHTSLFAKRELLCKEKFNTKYRIGADSYFILKCFYVLHANFGFLDQEIAYFSLSGVSSDAKKCEEEMNEIIKDLGLTQFYYRKKKKFRHFLAWIVSKAGVRKIFKIILR